MGRGRNGCKRGKAIVKEGLGQCVPGDWEVLLRGWRPVLTLLAGSRGCQGPFSELNRYV